MFSSKAPKFFKFFCPNLHYKLLYYLTYLFTILILVPHPIYFFCNLLT